MRANILRTVVLLAETLYLAFGWSALAQQATPLHQLSAGSRLVPLQKLLIPANTDQVTMSSGLVPGASCTLRVKERKPFARVLLPENPLVVSDVTRAGFSSPHRSSMTTYVHFRSRAIDDLLCVADHGSHEMTFSEFQRVVSNSFSVEPSEQAVAVID